MKGILENLVVVLIILLILFGPFLVICALVGKIALSILNPFVAGRDWKFADIHLKGRTRVFVSVIGVIAWVVVWTIAYFVLCSAFPSLPTCLNESTPTPTHTSVPALTNTPTPTLAPTATNTPTSTPTPISCVCQRATADDTLRCLINAESKAANSDDLSLIRQIFAPDATIFRGDTEKEWDNPMAYYEPTLAGLNFTETKHFDIYQIEFTANSAKYTSGSSGYYAESGTTPTSYYNENPSEHWIFGKNDQGCWVITRFEFNASHLKFP